MTNVVVLQAEDVQRRLRRALALAEEAAQELMPLLRDKHQHVNKAWAHLIDAKDWMSRAERGEGER